MKTLYESIFDDDIEQQSSKVLKDTLESWYYKPKTRDELYKSVMAHIDAYGDECDLNDIDTSRITVMDHLFQGLRGFNGDVSKWNVSKVTSMNYMFAGCIHFNQPLNNWNVSKVVNMGSMFYECKNFNQPLNNWNVSKVVDMGCMFSGCTNFNQDISKWEVNKPHSIACFRTFHNCPIDDKFKPKFIN